MDNSIDWNHVDLKWEFLSLSTFFSRRFKLAYIATPKVACTTLKWWFARIENQFERILQHADSDESTMYSKVHDVFRQVAPEVTGLSKQRLIEIYESSDTYQFALVRNPYTRTFSAWQSKILLKEPQQIRPYRELPFVSYPFNSIDNLARAFEAFLQFLHESPNHLHANFHWIPQTKLLRPDVLRNLNIFHLESRSDLSRVLGERYKGLLSDPFAVSGLNESLFKYNQRYITKRSEELITKLFEEDFVTFDYPTEVPQVGHEINTELFDAKVHFVELIRSRQERLLELKDGFRATESALRSEIDRLCHENLLNLARADDSAEKLRSILNSRSWKLVGRVKSAYRSFKSKITEGK